MVDPLTAQIQSHYDKLSYLYRRLWGNHIHHGLFRNGTDDREAAQVALIEELVRFANVPRGTRVLDVGCGLGGSSIWLAEELGCRCVGITISPVQAKAARKAARKRGVPAEFLAMEASRANVMGAGRFDVVWCIECSEHVRDKKRLVRLWSELLTPGGKVALCAWCEADGITPEQRAEFIEPVNRGMLLPGMISAAEYVRLMEAAGLKEARTQDLTADVRRTWEICREQVQRPGMGLLARVLGARSFVASFDDMLRGYDSGALRYAMIAASKPS